MKADEKNDNTSGKAFKAKQDKLAAEYRKLKQDVKADTGKPRKSWRDCYQVHPACEVFPAPSKDELRKLADDIDANGLEVPIQTRHVAGADGGRTYVIDGRSRLDAMESLGWQIVNVKGEWIGALAGKVEHRAGRTHEQIVAEVISLNITRRHLNESQRAMIAAKLANMRQGARTDLEPSANLPEVSQPQAAKLFKVGERSVRAAKKVMREGSAAQVEAITSGAKSVSKAVGELKHTRKTKLPKKEKSLEDRVWHKYTLFLKMKEWQGESEREVKLALIGCLLRLYNSGTDKFVMPVSVTYHDPTNTPPEVTCTLTDLLTKRIRIGERAKSKLVSSQVWHS